MTGELFLKNVFGWFLTVKFKFNESTVINGSFNIGSTYTSKTSSNESGTSIFTIENQHFLVAPQASWPQDLC